MTPLQIADHLFNFILPALAVGGLCALFGRFVGRRGAGSWWLQAAVNAVVGAAVLVAGLVVFGHDGRMATYGALVLACGTSQWLLAGGWRR
jgi:hypothetical protein